MSFRRLDELSGRLAPLRRLPHCRRGSLLSNVIRAFGAAPPDEDMNRLLNQAEAFMDLVKSGQIIAFMVATIHADRSTGSMWSTTDHDTTSLIGAVELAKTRLITG